MNATRHWSETDLPEGRADRYRANASEVRAVALVTRFEESRTSLLSLANAYERMADAAEHPLPTSSPGAPFVSGATLIFHRKPSSGL
jgi:hypothetical protein